MILGVGGGIAAYKACDVASRLTQDKHEVSVVMTQAATQFVAPLTYASLTGRPVSRGFEDGVMGPLSHVHLARWADAMVIVPATADLISRLAQGRADDLLAAIYLGFQGPRLFAPAMEPEMWSNPRTKANVETLAREGAVFIGPEEGRMASGYQGFGRLSDPREIVEFLYRIVTPKDMTGIRILVTAGATWEYFDPVRLLTNPSTGMMGVALAEAAFSRGADVTLVHGPGVHASLPKHVTRVPVTSAREMHDAVLRLMPDIDVMIGAAAVSDFRPKSTEAHKAHKASLGLSWEMELNPDVIQDVAHRFGERAVLIGYAAETDDVIASAERKLIQKGVDAVVANQVGMGRGFGSGLHQAWLVTATGVAPLAGDSKQETASEVLDFALARMKERFPDRTWSPS